MCINRQSPARKRTESSGIDHSHAARAESNAGGWITLAKAAQHDGSADGFLAAESKKLFGIGNPQNNASGNFPAFAEEQGSGAEGEQAERGEVGRGFGDGGDDGEGAAVPLGGESAVEPEEARVVD